jgi:hypothetical protein
MWLSKSKSKSNHHENKPQQEADSQNPEYQEGIALQLWA